MQGAQGTVSPSKWKHWSLEQRKVCCRAVQEGNGWCSKSPELSEGFGKVLVTARWGRGVTDSGIHLCTSLPGWWGSGRVVSQGLTLSVLMLQESLQCAKRVNYLRIQESRIIYFPPMAPWWSLSLFTKHQLLLRAKDQSSHLMWSQCCIHFSHK